MTGNGIAQILVFTAIIAAVAMRMPRLSLLALHESGSQLAQAIGRDRKGKVSLAAYVASLAFAAVLPWVSIALFVAVAVIWFLPDRRVERVIGAA